MSKRRETEGRKEGKGRKRARDDNSAYKKEGGGRGLRQRPQ